MKNAKNLAQLKQVCHNRLYRDLNLKLKFEASMKQLFFLLILSALFTPSAYALFGSDKVTKCRGCSGAGDNVDCLPNDLKAVAKRIADEFGQVEIASGARFGAANAKRGGAKNSLHTKCRAIDFRVPNYSSVATQRKLRAFLKSQPVRYNVYCTGRTHIDNSSGLPNSYSSCLIGYRKGAFLDGRGRGGGSSGAVGSGGQGSGSSGQSRSTVIRKIRDYSKSREEIKIEWCQKHPRGIFC